MSAGTYNLVIDQGSDFALDLVVKQSGSALNLDQLLRSGTAAYESFFQLLLLLLSQRQMQQMVH